MIWYYIYLPEGVDIKVDVHSMIDALRQSWPNITIDDKPSSSIVLSWEINLLEAEYRNKTKKFIAGTLYDDLQKIFITGDIDACISFALWYRTIIPLEAPLLFQDDTQEHVIELKANTTSVEIMKTLAPEIDHIQREVLSLLASSNGKLTTNRLLKALREIFAALPEETFGVHVETALADLWEKNLISSPGRRWALTTSPRIQGIMLDHDSVHYELTLTDKGQFALKAQQ